MQLFVLLILLYPPCAAVCRDCHEELWLSSSCGQIILKGRLCKWAFAQLMAWWWQPSSSHQKSDINELAFKLWWRIGGSVGGSSRSSGVIRALRWDLYSRGFSWWIYRWVAWKNCTNNIPFLINTLTFASRTITYVHQSIIYSPFLWGYSHPGVMDDCIHWSFFRRHLLLCSFLSLPWHSEFSVAEISVALWKSLIEINLMLRDPQKIVLVGIHWSLLGMWIMMGWGMR
jgi:hypothetical protein